METCAGLWAGIRGSPCAWFVSLRLPACDHVYLGVYMLDADLQTRSAHGVFSFKSWCVRV